MSLVGDRDDGFVAVSRHYLQINIWHTFSHRSNACSVFFLLLCVQYLLLEMRTTIIRTTSGSNWLWIYQFGLFSYCVTVCVCEIVLLHAPCDSCVYCALANVKEYV